MKVNTNKEIAKILREVAAVYEVKEEDRFRVAAYNKAADSIEHSSVEAKTFGMMVSWMIFPASARALPLIWTNTSKPAR